MKHPAEIELKKVGTNNLQDIDVSFPIGALSVVTGVSGSGKSSLVFDTLYGEAYRRYVESLSSFARQYLKALPKPKVGSVENLPPAIAVKQARSGATSRSTVGTMTEIADLLRVVFTHLSEIYCFHCDLPVKKYSGEQIAKEVQASRRGEKVLILAPLKSWKGMKGTELKTQLGAQGFSRLLLDGEIVKIESVKVAELWDAHVVIDRISVGAGSLRRLAEASTLALKVGRESCAVAAQDSLEKLRVFSAKLECSSCERVFYEPTIALFSFNHPYGACSKCQGFGAEPVIDYKKTIPDMNASLKTKGVAVWNWGKHDEMYYWARDSAKARKISLTKPFSDYTASDWRWLKEGDGKDFNGIEGYYKWLVSKRHKAHYRIHAARYRKYVTCGQCDGARLNQQALACVVDQKNIATVSALSVLELSAWIKSIDALDGKLSSDQERRVMGVKEALEELNARLAYLQKVGLGYISIDRLTRTLSGGEHQRINMARCLGSALTDTMYCLDEPTAGLHVRDSENLLGVLCELRDQGNSVIVVEHEQAVIAGADYLVEIGPEAGHLGGGLTFAGKPKKTKSAKTVQWPAAKQSLRQFMTLTGAETHNLKKVTVKIPTGAMTAVCGVSGSGKTSLIQHTLYPLLSRFYGKEPEALSTEPVAKGIGPPKALEQFSQVVLVSQAQIGRSTRSNIVTYLGIFDHVRKLLASTAAAKKSRLQPGSFSFNTPGGRCER